MLSIIYAECHKKPFMLSAIMLIVIMLRVVAPRLITPIIEEPYHASTYLTRGEVTGGDKHTSLQYCCINYHQMFTVKALGLR
jgi:hypothetical protein